MTPELVKPSDIKKRGVTSQASRDIGMTLKLKKQLMENKSTKLNSLTSSHYYKKMNQTLQTQEKSTIGGRTFLNLNPLIKTQVSSKDSNGSRMVNNLSLIHI